MFQVKTRTWSEWDVEETDLEKGHGWGSMYSGILDFDAETAVYLDKGEKAGHCQIYNK